MNTNCWLKAFTGITISSAFEDKSSPHHWEHYGRNGHGYAIEFELNEKYRQGNVNTNGDYLHSLIKVIYDPEQQKALARDFLLSLTKEADPNFLLQLTFLVEFLCIKFKDPQYLTGKGMANCVQPFGIGWLFGRKRIL